MDFEIHPEIDPHAEAFTHADGRQFIPVGTSPHTTRDGRSVTLKVWKTCCTSSGCEVPLLVRVATPTPQTWRNFMPPKFCDSHRAVARKANQINLVKARANGLAKWRESPEGAAVLARRKRDGMGSVEKLVYEKACDLSLADPAVPWPALRTAVLAAMDPPAEGKRDTRPQRISRAFWALEWEKERLSHRNGLVTVLR